MKSILFIAVLFCSSLSFAQNATDIIKFEKMSYDFGNIVQSKPVSIDFKFKNVGKTPLTVESATASCGCTTPTWPQAAIMKGKTDIIKAGFNAASPGVFDKTITVKIAGIATPVELKIKGTVLTPDEFAKLTKAKPKNKS